MVNLDKLPLSLLCCLYPVEYQYMAYQAFVKKTVTALYHSSLVAKLYIICIFIKIYICCVVIDFFIYQVFPNIKNGSTIACIHLVATNLLFKSKMM